MVTRPETGVALRQSNQSDRLETMCIAFPKAADGNDQREPTWKSALLLIPRMLSLLWMLTRLLVTGARNWLNDRRQAVT